MSSSVVKGVTGLLVVLLSGCSSGAVGSPSTESTFTAGPVAQLVSSDKPRSAVPAADSTAGTGIAEFGAQLLRALPADGNLVISPYSVYAVLAMAGAGSVGSVADELDSILGTTAPGGAVTAVDAALELAVTRGQAPQAGDSEVVIDPANSLWVQDGAIKQTFLDAIAADYGAGVYLTDYTDPERSRLAINGWVSDHTKALIPQLIPAGAITAETVLTLVSALYFAAPWAGFYSVSAEPLAFELQSGDTVEVPAFGGGDPLNYAAGDNWRSVTVPYQGYGAAMTVIVPDPGEFDAVQESLDAELIAAAQAGTQRRVILTMPKFDIDYTSSLRDALTAIGAPTLFADADWSGISDDHGLAVTDVVHQAVITTDEKGTVAAAATAMMMAGSAPPSDEPVEFTVKRPFFFVLHDTTTCAPLFLGRVLNPTA